MALIEAVSLRKEYAVRQRRPGLVGSLRDLFSGAAQTKVAVDGIDLSIEAGEAVGYVGPNGAGKSTTIKMLTGILVPTAGTVRVSGLEPWRHRKQNGQNIGVVFGQRTQLWWDLPVMDSFDMLRHIYRVPADRHRQNVNFFLEVLGIDRFATTPVRLLSLGQRMRAEVASAFLHDPSIVYLDEPTIGLDVVARERIRDFLSMMNRERELTIVLTTHDLTDIERVCRRLVLIDHGRLAYDGSLEEFRRRYGRYRTLMVETPDGLSRSEVPELGELLRREGPRSWIRFDRDRTTASQLLVEIAKLMPVLDCATEEPTIESILRDLYEQGPVTAMGQGGRG